METKQQMNELKNKPRKNYVKIVLKRVKENGYRLTFENSWQEFQCWNKGSPSVIHQFPQIRSFSMMKIYVLVNQNEKKTRKWGKLCEKIQSIFK